MNSFESVDVTETPGVASRLVKVLIYVCLGSVVAWRSFTYDTKLGEAYPVLPMFMCACLISILYTLSIVTLAGRSAVLATASVDGGRDDSTHQRAADRARA
jgi:hypothetical protein